MFRRVGKMIFPADDVSDFHKTVINADREMKRRVAVGADNHEIPDHLVEIEMDFTADHIGHGDFRVLNFKTDRGFYSAGFASFDFVFTEISSAVIKTGRAFFKTREPLR